jgi:hypothetical protein
MSMTSTAEPAPIYNENELRWLGGLLDGKGAFGTKERNGRWRPRFYLNTVRYSLLQDIKRVLGFGSVAPRDPGSKAKQPQFCYEIVGLMEFGTLENLVSGFMRTSRRDEFEATRDRARMRNEQALALSSSPTCIPENLMIKHSCPDSEA